MTEKELERKMKQIMEDHRGLIIDADFDVVKEKEKNQELISKE